MIVGEAPGQLEDQRGEPFVGPSGNLLSRVLGVVGLHSAYFTNVVKCFPNGPPSSTSVAACKDYLREEIEHVKPDYILALGNSAWHVFGRGPITEHAGREIWHETYRCWVMPALHPAAILRNPHQQPAWESDLHRFARLVRGELKQGSKPPVAVFVLGEVGWEKL